MLPLPSTKYPNVQRTVTGLVDVFPDDVILNCDTSTGAVTINLGEIPYNTTTGVGYWSTQYKLYINDISNNAGTNNITLVAGLGQTINNAATAVLSSNGANAYVIITGNTEYSVFYAPAQATPTNFISVTYAQLSALITANTLIPNANYNVTDAEFGSTPIIPTSIYIQALTTNTVSLSGQGYFFNADYQGVGTYGGIIGFAGQLGIWNLALAPIINNVCIWNNVHYLNNTGANGAINPETDTVNWQPLARQVPYGYMVEISSISYNPTNNTIISRKDGFNNFVERTVLTGRNSLNFFKWGSVNVRQNNVSKDSVLYNCNTITAGANSFFGNDFFDSEVILGNTTTEGGNIVDWSNNVIESSPINFVFFGGNLINNKFNKFNLGGENTGTIQENIISSAILVIINSGTIENNVFKNLRTFTITSNSGNIYENTISSGTFEITTLNKGSINNNVFNSSSFIVDTNEINADITYNTCDTSSISITTNEATISYNALENESLISINTVSAIGGVKYINITNQSTFQLGSVDTIIGIGSKGKGVTISNNSVILLDNCLAGSQFYANVIDNGTIITVTTFNGAIFSCSISTSYFYFDSLGFNTIQASNFSTVSIGNFLLTYVLPSSIQNTTAIKGLSTVRFNLDCSDITIYDAGTQTLTIPPDMALIGGDYILSNAGGITITKIIALSNSWRTTFSNDNGTTTFQSNAVVGASGMDIVSSIGAGAFSVVYRASGSDSIVLKYQQTLCVVKETNILA